MEIERGQVFDQLTVVEEVDPGPPNNRRIRCYCSCGNEKIAFLSNLRLGRTRSCGCTYVFGEKARAQIVEKRRAAARITHEGRICLTCSTWKPWAEFSLDKRGSTGRASNCKACGARRRLLLAYGITGDDIARLRGLHGGCHLCGNTDDRLVVDHDHSCCGKVRGCRKCVRGLLCDFCNRVLGRIEQRPALARRFADYLESRPLVA